MIVCDCLSYQLIHSQHQLNLCYPKYSCEHAPPILERAVGCFPYLTCGIFLRSLKQKRCRYFRHLRLVKVTIIPSSLLKKLLLRYMSWNFLIMVLIAIVSWSLTSNKLGYNFNCDTNLLTLMPSLLTSNKKVLSRNWSATNNNCECEFQVRYLNERDFLLTICHMSLFGQKVKNVHDETKNRLNTFSNRLRGGEEERWEVIRVTKEIDAL